MKSTIWIARENEEFWINLENKSGWVNAIIEALLEAEGVYDEEDVVSSN